MAAVVIAVVIAAAVVAVVQPSSSQRATVPTITFPELEPPSLPGSFDRSSGGSDPTLSGSSAIGTITWIRSGAVGELPERIALDSDGSLIGWDADGTWRPGATLGDWVRTHDESRSIAGHRWTRTIGEGTSGLVVETPTASVDLVDAAALLPHPGDILRVTPLPGPNGGFPLELGGAVVVPVVVRRGLPWTDIAGTDYRVEVTHGDRTVRLASGAAGDRATLPLSVERVGGTSWRLRDDDGTVDWPFEVEAARSPLDVLAGRTEVAWLEWTDGRFELLEQPWPVGSDVAMVSVDGGLLARSAGSPGYDAALWITGDGRTWTRVELPGERSAGTPVALTTDGDAAIITLFTEAGLRPWATTNGIDLTPLPAVPGIERRSRGEFGWVAADPRNAPTLRVSPDGLVWDEVDIGPILGLDASRWDVSISAAAVGDRIVVLADRPLGRTLLVGLVDDA